MRAEEFKRKFYDEIVEVEGFKSVGEGLVHHATTLERVRLKMKDGRTVILEGDRVIEES